MGAATRGAASSAAGPTTTSGTRGAVAARGGGGSAHSGARRTTHGRRTGMRASIVHQLGGAAEWPPSADQRGRHREHGGAERDEQGVALDAGGDAPAGGDLLGGGRLRR